MASPFVLPALDTVSLLAGLAVSYLLFVQFSRWRVLNHVHAKYAHRVRDLESLTATEAQDIIHASMLWDLPAVVFNALSFAIVRTYAIPSISRILVGTKELQAGPSVSKRYLDTAIIVATFGTCPIDPTAAPTEFYASLTESKDAHSSDSRSYVAIARMNWIHSHYSISNEDYLYTLALFVFEPIRWARLYGWRPLSPLEVQARYVFYKRIGEMMNIRDIPDTVDEFEAWTEDYELRCMVPANSNNALAEGMLSELASSVPSFARGLFKRLVICTMDERMRIAMKLPEQPRILYGVVNIGTALMRFVGRHLLLPRLRPYLIIPVKTPPTPAHGGSARVHPYLKVTKPWYMPRATGVWRLVERAALLFGFKNIDDVAGPQYGDKGYRLEELGPLRWKNAGHDKVMSMAGEMMGCPVPHMRMGDKKSFTLG